MKRIHWIALLCLHFICLTACQADDPPIAYPDDEPPIIVQTPVLAGQLDTSMAVHENPNAHVVFISFDSLNQFANGVDSIDLDQDGQVDLDIQLRMVNPDSIYLIGQYYTSPQYTLHARPGWKLAYQVERVPMGMGAFMELEWAEKLALNDTVDTVTKWDSLTSLWRMIPFWGNYGPWYLDRSTTFLGVMQERATFNRYGWIEVESPSISRIVLRRWALKN